MSFPSLMRVNPIVGLQGYWRRWQAKWKALTLYQQDRLANLAPLTAVLMFMLVILLAFLYLQNEEQQQHIETLSRDKDYFVQRMNLRLREQQSKITSMVVAAKDKGLYSYAADDAARLIIDEYPEILSISWLDANRKITNFHVANGLSYSSLQDIDNYLQDPASVDAFEAAKKVSYPVFSDPIVGELIKDKSSRIQMYVPLIDAKQFKGMLVVEYSLDSLLHYAVPTEVSNRYAVAAYYQAEENKLSRYLGGKTLGNGDDMLGFIPRLGKASPTNWSVPILGNKLVFSVQPYSSGADLISRGLFWLAGILSVLTAWMLYANWRHARRRNETQKALEAETHFRRAMENSMLIGLRVMDMDARVTYVNPAFCQMTGFSEAEMLHQKPPYVYWPETEVAKLSKTLELELRDRDNVEGNQVKFRRKNGQIFYARVYTAPLVDNRNVQNGWISSLTDITEPTLIRQQLSESHERFTTVLEGLDASISVTPLGSSELLFANKVYREWFGTVSVGHQRLVAEAGVPQAQSHEEVDSMAGMPDALIQSSSEHLSENAEIYIPEIKRWLEVRSRYLNWVDGRLAQMVIASDISPRRHAEKAEAEQADRVEKISRLITMGEMASGVAHELNQPLTAINNYCTGMLTRIRNKQLVESDLQNALEKTAKQAQRAGQIIQGIRDFVKKSEPKRVDTTVENIVNTASDLANIELSRRNVALRVRIEARIPVLHVDTVLIEQVLINLLKNAAESVDQAERKIGDRLIDLRVKKSKVDDQEVVEFLVRDNGLGIAPDVMNRLYETFFSTKSDGMGMGLSLCRSIVESHQGRISAENLYNGVLIDGCVFRFWLPLRQVTQPLAALTESSQ